MKCRVGCNTALPPDDCHPDNCGEKKVLAALRRVLSYPAATGYQTSSWSLLEKSWIADPLDSSLEPCVLVSSFFGLGEGN